MLYGLPQIPDVHSAEFRLPLPGPPVGLSGVASVANRDWYGWGCRILLPRQQPDGSWTNGGYPGNWPVVDTCFALLFLKQANLAQDLTAKLRLLSEKSRR